MPNYSNVQFIAWSIYTGPVYDDSLSGGIDYPGIAFVPGDRRLDVLGQFLDIKARVAFTKLAIETAYANTDPNNDVLKVFMAPEFLYRGAAGAYVYDLLNGWAKNGPGPNMLPPPCDREWPGLFGELRELVRDSKFQNWVFVFGTAVGAAFQCSNGRIIINPDGSTDYPASGWNLSLIQCGGDTEEQHRACYFTQKHLKSGIDFIRFNLFHPGTHFFTHESTEHTTREEMRILDRLILDNPLPQEAGGALFRFPHIHSSDGSPIQFGLEICKDHVQEGPPSSPVTGRLAVNGEQVGIQLVPSCGISLQESSLALAPKDGPKPYSYAFNCDGLTTYDPHDPQTMYLGGHIQLWGGSVSEVPGGPPRYLKEIVNSLQDPHSFPVGDSVDLSGIQLPQDIQEALEIDLSHIPAARLWHSHAPFPTGGDSHNFPWPEGAGFIHVLEPQPLGPPAAPEENASEAPSSETLLALIKDNLDAFGKHYTLSSVKVTGKHVSKGDSGFHVDFCVELKAMLKCAAVCQLPHVQGIIKLLGINAPKLSAGELSSALDTKAVRAALSRSVRPCVREIIGEQADLEQASSLTAGAVELAAEKIRTFVSELESLYIGQTSTISLSFRAAFSGGGTPLSVMAVAHDGSAYDAELLVPEADSKMRANGQTQLQDIISGAVKTVLNRAEPGGTPPEAREVYRRVKARDYANAWTSNPVHGTKDLTKWNTKDNPQVQCPPYPANPNGDCANYVSQAIFAGGILMTSKEKSDACHWFAGPHGCSLAWENCTALHAYFTGKQYWTHSDLTWCRAGGVIFFKDKSGKRYHVVMCVQNDTVTRTYSAHTHDRRCQAYTVPDSFGVEASALECWEFRNSTTN